MYICLNNSRISPWFDIHHQQFNRIIRFNWLLTSSANPRYNNIHAYHTLTLFLVRRISQGSIIFLIIFWSWDLIFLFYNILVFMNMTWYVRRMFLVIFVRDRFTIFINRSSCIKFEDNVLLPRSFQMIKWGLIFAIFVF